MNTGQLAYNNLIYHNDIIDNITQATDGATNKWDNGYPSGGNYWSDYTGEDKFSGPDQDQPGSDGIGDTPYLIPKTGKDNYPLMGIDTGSINGLVTDCLTGDQIGGALVIAIQKPTKVPAFTDENGYYELADLEPGVWWLIGIKRRYRFHIAKIEVKAGEPTTHDFCMNPK